MNKGKVTIIGAGFVGMSMATLFAKHNQVHIYDINEDVIDSINRQESPVYDLSISNYFERYINNISASSQICDIPNNSDFYIVSISTDYDKDSNLLNVSGVDETIKLILDLNKEAMIIIKSTVPIGFTDGMKIKYQSNNIIFSPEFLREGSALEDNLNPSRIIIGGDEINSKLFVETLLKCTQKNNPPLIYMKANEAESVKLFSNAFLAMRVAFFNELDTFALASKMSSQKIINGVSMDERIGNYYNNPSFGYGGYCLPKDSKQLLANFKSIPQDLIQSIIESNKKRKSYMVEVIINKNCKNVGIYKLSMKKGSKNFKESAILDIINELQNHKVNISIYDPSVNKRSVNNAAVISDLSSFKKKSDIIIANRFDDELKDVSDKVFTRDVFREN